VDLAAYSEVWGTWWLGDVSGALVVAPLLITWSTAAPPFPRRASLAETLALAAIVLLVGAVLFTDVFPVSLSRAPIGFLAFPVFAWAAYRFGARGASLSVAVLGAIGGWGTLRGYGPFVREGTNESLLLLQSFMAVAALTSLALAAADLERRRADDALRAGEERKVQERDEFLGVAAHELRTPITSLQLSVQFLLRQIERGFSPGSVELSRALMTVGDQSTKLTRLVSQLLDNVRLDADRLQIERQPVDIAALVTSVVAEVRRITGRADIHLVTAPADADVDPLRLEQVIRNLLDNAVKFSPQGGDIEVRAGTSGPGHVAIVVRDHGVGVPPERRPGLFQRYQHMEGSPGGLGLGLYVSRQIVERHGGQIEAEFPEDGGTRIVVTLPIATAAPEVVAAGE
jgi:signal transduction histidine kinase